MKNKIILTAEADLNDEGAREWLKQMDTKLVTLNDRTKKHTREIAELRKMIELIKKYVWEKQNDN